MAKRWRQKVLLATVRTVETARADPAVAGAILAANIELQPVEAETANRELERAYYGASADINYNVRQRLSFDVDFAAGGATGTAPGWGGIIQACGMSEAVNAAVAAAAGVWTRTKGNNGDYDTGAVVTHNDKKWRSTVDNNNVEPAAGAAGWEEVPPASVVYTPITGGEKVVDFFLYIDGVRHRLDACRGTWTLNFQLGIPRIRFEFTGQFADPTDDNNPTPTSAALDKFKDPLVPSRTNTPTVSLHGASVALSNLQLAYGANVVARDIPGEASIEIVDRQASGQLTVDAPTVAGLALVKRAKEGLSGAFQMVHGVGAGKIITLDMPDLQLSSPSYSEADGYWQVQANIRPLPESGNDEIKLTTT